MATTTYINQVAGALTQVRTVEVSAGAGDASKVPNLNAAGVLDLTVVNGKTSSAGAGDASKLAALDGTGRLDSSMMPVGVTVETAQAVATEAIAAGGYGNLFLAAGVLKVRNADATIAGREADCFLLSSVAISGTAVCYLEGVNTQLSGRTIGAVQFLSVTTPGAAQEAAPTVAGQTLQRLGKAISATAATFERNDSILLA